MAPDKTEAGVKGEETTGLERSEQKALVAYLRWRYPDLLFSSFPNDFPLASRLSSGGRVAIIQHMKALGMTPGMPDLVIFAPRAEGDAIWHGMMIEMKGKKTPLRAEQADILRRLRELGYKAVIARSFEEARMQVDDYLSLPLP